jgi:hypothetical protein
VAGSVISPENKWLFEKVGGEPNPIFALQSSLNWIKSLSFEISAHYGASVDEQVAALSQCPNLGRVTQNGNFGNVPIGEAFGCLFSGITYTLALKTAIDAPGNKAWTYPSAIIQWYYSVYNSLRSINLSQTLNPTDTHSGMVKSVNQFSHLLPHPFDMVADWVAAENYTYKLPLINFSGEADLISAFSATRPSCQGMLVKYLKGTAAWELDYTKEELKKKHRLDSFRTNAAKQIRDRYCVKKINFLNCAFRYRGKANYRDTLFLTYGVHDPRFGGDYLSSLYNSARFLNLAALEFQRKRLNPNVVDEFTSDITRNLRHIEEIPDPQRFWE